MLFLYSFVKIFIYLYLINLYLSLFYSKEKYFFFDIHKYISVLCYNTVNVNPIKQQKLYLKGI